MVSTSSFAGTCQILLLIVFIASCSEGNRDAKSGVQEATQESQTFKNLIAPSDEQVQAFAESFEKAIQGGDARTADNLIDYDFILGLATEVPNSDPEFQRAFSQGFKANLGAGGIAHQIIAKTRVEGSFHLLRTHTVGNQKRALFRAVFSDGSLNYYDMIIGVRPGPEVKAVDIYVLVSGEQISQTIRRFYLMTASQANPSLFERLAGSEGDLVKNVEILANVNQQLQSGNGQAAMESFRQLPKSMQEEKGLMLLALQASTLVGNEEYLALMGEFRRLFANDPCCDIISIDYHFLRKEYDEALQCIDRLDASIGGDPYLNVHRANVLVELGKLDEARSLSEATIEKSPELEDIYWVVVTITLRQKRFADTVTWLNRLLSQFELELADLQAIPEYSEFIQSPEYSAWMAERDRPSDR